MITALLILDGFGYSDKVDGNAVHAADMKNIESLKKRFPNTLIETSGKAVGLTPEGVGNSETGHLHIGAGRIVWQPLSMITNAIEDGSFFENKILKKMIGDCVENLKKFHVCGLVSDGGVHSHIFHLIGLMEMAKREGLNEIYIHAFGDGRDVGERTMVGYLNTIKEKAQEIGIEAVIVDVIGRFYAMDRDNNDTRIAVAVDLLRKGIGQKFDNYKDAIEGSYGEKVESDYYLPAMKFTDDVVEDGDSLLFFNFRTDRARQLTKALMDEGKVGLVCMTPYDKEWDLPAVFVQNEVTNCLGEVLSNAGLKQWRISETEKFAHVTFFMNALRDEPYPGEERILIDSAKVDSFKEKPEMEARKITEEILKVMKNEEDAVIIANFANLDLVGHSGDWDATVAACKVVDECVGRVVEALLAKGGKGILTADHGNAEDMLYENGDQKPGHSTNKVPFIAIGCDGGLTRDGGSLIDVAPSLLKLIGIKQPSEMEGVSLI